jgi:hypothetical protein
MVVDGVAVDVDPAEVGKVELKLADTMGSDGKKHKVCFRKMRWCDQGILKEVIVAASDPYFPVP